MVMGMAPRMKKNTIKNDFSVSASEVLRVENINDPSNIA